MTVDSLAADGAAVLLPTEPQGDPGNAFVQVGYAISADQQDILVLSMQPTDASYYKTGAQQLWVEDFTTAGRAAGGGVVANTVNEGAGAALFAPEIAALGNGSVAVAWQVQNQAGAQVHYSVSQGGWGAVPEAAGADVQGPPTLFATIGGFALEMSYQSTSGGPYGSELQTVDPSGHEVGLTTTPSSGPVSDDFGAHAYASGGGAYLQVIDNTLQYYANGVLNDPVTIPGEQPMAIEFEAAALLANGDAVVAWSDAHAEYLSLFDPASNSLGAPMVVSASPAGLLHAVALPDGGFVLSWVTPSNTHAGEVFDAAGHGGGVIALAGDAAGIDANGEFYTVGRGSGGQYQVQHYTITAGSSGGAGGGGTTGQTFTSDNSGDHWTGTAGDDLFHLGRGGDVVTGNGGDDTYAFAEIPWAGGHITDFNAGDVLDLTGLMSTTADAGTDGFADGYLKITSDSQGDAQVWAQYAASGSSSGWWLVETLDGVSASSLQTSGDVVTVGSGGSGSGPTAVTTSDPNYVAPANVSSITLSGSQQHIDASATSGVTIVSNNTGNTLIGGNGDDLFHLGRGGDTVTGGAGADTFAYAETPWTAGQITDFSGVEGDVIDVRGMLQASGYAGSDPFTDGYLRITDSSAGAQIWSDVNQPGNDGWWLVATIDGVSTSSLHYSAGLIT